MLDHGLRAVAAYACDDRHLAARAPDDEAQHTVAFALVERRRLGRRAQCDYIVDAAGDDALDHPLQCLVIDLGGRCERRDECDADACKFQIFHIVTYYFSRSLKECALLRRLRLVLLRHELVRGVRRRAAGAADHLQELLL